MNGWFDRRAATDSPPASAAEWWERNYDRAMTRTSRLRYVRQSRWHETSGWLRAALVILGLVILGIGASGVFA